jgi:hypothetical protein
VNLEMNQVYCEEWQGVRGHYILHETFANRTDLLAECG